MGELQVPELTTAIRYALVVPVGSLFAITVAIACSLSIAWVRGKGDPPVPVDAGSQGDFADFPYSLAILARVAGETQAPPAFESMTEVSLS